MKKGMNLYIKTPVSNFELCVICLRMYILNNHLCKMYRLYLDGVLVGPDPQCMSCA